jgi:hypothetical protein
MSSEETQEVAIVKVPYLAPLAPFTTGISIEERFNSFHRANPQVYEALRELALHLAATGRRTFGMKALFEFLRFSYALQTSGDSYKINNSYAPFYARLLMRNEQALAGFFNLRTRWGKTQ